MEKKCLNPIIITPKIVIQNLIKAMLLSAPRSIPWPHPPTAFGATTKNGKRFFKFYFKNMFPSPISTTKN
jgi:hypothetical protein